MVPHEGSNIISCRPLEGSKWPLGGFLQGLGVVLAALRAPDNDLDGSGSLLETLRSALGGLWRALGRLLEASSALLVVSGRALVVVLEAHGAPQRLL